jgi:hypothetical protein
MRARRVPVPPLAHHLGGVQRLRGNALCARGGATKVQTGAVTSRHLGSGDPDAAEGERVLAAEVRRLQTELNEAHCSYVALEQSFAEYKVGERIPSSKEAEFGGDARGTGSAASTAAATAHHPAEQLLNHRFSNSDTRRRKMRILSMDGGGARGLYTATILARICREEPRLLDNIDLIAGTSTGAVIGMLLASDVPPAEIEQIFRQLAPKIFAPMPLWRRAVAPFFASSYDAEVRSQIFSEWTQGKTFADIKPWLLITTFKVDGINPHPSASIFGSCSRWRPGLLTNIPRMQGLVEPDLPLTLHDTLMYSTAAPVYFPIQNGYIDGGVFANNPSLCAMTRALANIPQLSSKDVCVLSLGTGVRPMRLDIDSNGVNAWGLGKWAPHLVDLLFDSSNRTVNLHMAYLLGQRYHRLNPELDYDVALDDVSEKSFAMLKIKAEETDLTRTREFIAEHFVTGEPPLWQAGETLSDWNPQSAWQPGGEGDALVLALR